MMLVLPAGYDQNPDLPLLRHINDAMLAASCAFSVDQNAVQRATGENNPEQQGPAQGIVRKLHQRTDLRVLFFGNFELLYGGATLPLSHNAKVKAILKFVMANRGRPISRDVLMGWLWPEVNLKQARSSLNSAICVLRKVLSELPMQPETHANCLLYQDGCYFLNPVLQIVTDVDEFDVRYERGLGLEGEDRMQEAAAEYERAVALYRGDYLLEDLYEDWTMIERERLINAYVDMLGRLAFRYKEDGQLQESVRTCFRLLDKDRCHVDSHRLLVECYASLGYYGRASYQYRLFRDLFASIYGTEPSLETRVRFENILRSVSSR